MSSRSLCLVLIPAAALTGCIKEKDPWQGKSAVLEPPAALEGAGPVQTFAMTWDDRIEAARAANTEGRKDEAQTLYLACMAEVEKAGPTDPRYFTTLQELAYFYYFKGSYEVALTHFEKLQKAREQVRGAEHAEVATDLVNLGNVYSFLNRPADAEANFKRALAIREKLFGTESKEVGGVLKDYIALLRKSEREAEAVAMEARAEKIK